MPFGTPIVCYGAAQSSEQRFGVQLVFSTHDVHLQGALRWHGSRADANQVLMRSLLCYALRLYDITDSITNNVFCITKYTALRKKVLNT